MQRNSKSDNEKFTLFEDGTLHLYDNLHEVAADESVQYEGDLYITKTSLTQEEVEGQFDSLLAAEKEKWKQYMAKVVREQRNKLLAQADILVNKAVDTGVGETEAKAYRQALRDVPEQEGFPLNVVWPVLEVIR
ncbi:MAG: tail fiber assembly protein [Candidatus Methanomethylophilaceae archaeon]|jgi:glucosamine 6-phosphate synthetase-like amidotransferase/phosphosugar isomerase protein